MFWGIFLIFFTWFCLSCDSLFGALLKGLPGVFFSLKFFWPYLRAFCFYFWALLKGFWGEALGPSNTDYPRACPKENGLLGIFFKKIFLVFLKQIQVDLPGFAFLVRSFIPIIGF